MGHQPHNSLHGLTLKATLTELDVHFGFEAQDKTRKI